MEHDNLSVINGNLNKMAPLDSRYQAAMLLSGVGDSLGYKNGEWLFCSSGIKINEELEKLGGINNLNIKRPEWTVSSYTLLNLHTAIALTTVPYKTVNDSVFKYVAKMYKNKTDDWDMKARHPDKRFYAARERLNPGGDQGIVPFDVNGISSAAAVRGMCIGLRHPDPKHLHELIKLSIEIGRLLNHHPSGFLGTLTTALFTSYALQKKPVKQWGHGLIETLAKAMSYVTERGIAVQENLTAWNDFEDKWRSYLRLRKIETGQYGPEFPWPYDIKIRETFFKSISENETPPGSNGCDATIIAYDVFLSFDGTWEDMCVRSICHGGLSNVTCSLTACWYGAMYGYKGIQKCNYSKIEFLRLFKTLGNQLYYQSDNASLQINCKGLAEVENTENQDMASTNDDIRCIYVREGISTNNLIDDQVAKLRKDVTSDESMSIGDAIYSHLRNFLDKLGDEFPSCRVSELLKVGSFHEGTKIYFADEFDFIAVLSELSKPGMFVIESNCNDGGKVNIRFNDCSDLVYVNENWDNDELNEQQASMIREKVCTRLYNTVMTDRKSVSLISVYYHQNRAEWMALPSVKGIELSVRFSEVRSPNMVWEFLYKDRIISVDITLAVRSSNVKELFTPENATVLEVGKAILQRGYVLLAAYRDGFRLTITETEVEYVRKRLDKKHKHLYLYLKYFNYKYGDYTWLQRLGCLPFSSYMLKTMCIYHDLRCTKDKETITNETCLHDIVAIMEESLSKGYQYPAETVNGIVVGFLPSIFNKTKNLYKEPFKSVDRLKALREIMVRDMKTIHFSGRKWQGLSDMLKVTHDEIMTSAKEVCDQKWSDSKYALEVKLK